MIAWITFVLVIIGLELCFFHFVSIFVPSNMNNSLMVNLIVYMRYLNFPIFDLIVSSTVTYVFYYQAMELQREAKEKDDGHLQELTPSCPGEDCSDNSSTDNDERVNALKGLVNLSGHSKLLTL